tara:strand:- start:614 stop:1156 length:543 start_codon:yes stop_codon:yes gene_type:complete
MNWIEKVASHHKEYVATVKGFGEEFFAEDIVQESYIKVIKYCKESQLIDSDGDVRKAYMYFVLRNMFIDFQKAKKKQKKVDVSVLEYLGENIDLVEEQEKAEALNKIFDKVDTTLHSLHWYDELLYNLYKDSGKSMRTLSKDTGISTSSIFNTLKHCKDAIREDVGDDYEDYLNEEYELI